MLEFLNIAKQNITIVGGIEIRINAHFITDSSQAWIFSNVDAQEGVCEAYIHYISADNNKKMMMEQPLWRGYMDQELQDEETKAHFLEHIQEPMIHVILNVYQAYESISQKLLEFIKGVLRKKNPGVEEIIIDTFIYSKVSEYEDSNI